MGSSRACSSGATVTGDPTGSSGPPITRGSVDPESRRHQDWRRFYLYVKDPRRAQLALTVFDEEVLKDDKFVCRVEVTKMWCARGDEVTEVELFVL